MKKVELLSPAGDFECLKAAINNGADAVYIGGTNFSARSFAKNFDLDEVKEAVKYAHLRGSKIYLALNTLLDDDELDKAFELSKKYYELNVDALIIQDLGLFYRLKKELPDFELHASTQMHIHNLQGVKNAKELGFARAIVARESSLEIIKEFCKEDIEIECFVHGAICVSYSGQCLMSSFIKDRSANRGECAQCCRLKYYYYDSNKIYNSQTEYLLSPKDMMLIKDIPDLIDAGVSSFKIEGRLKSPSYVAFVTRLYRKAIDSYYEGKKYSVSNIDMDNLKVLFNRGYSNSYLKSNNNDLFNNSRPNNIGVEVGKVINSKNGFTDIKLKKELKLHDAIRIIDEKEDYGTELFEIYKNNKKIEKGEAGDIISIKTSRIFNDSDMVLKTGDLQLENDILSYSKLKKDIFLNMTFLPNNPIYIECKIDNNIFKYNNSYCPEESINYPITKETIIKQFEKVDDHPYHIIDFDFHFKDCFINIKKLNDIRRDFYNELDEYVLSNFKRRNISPNINLDSEIKVCLDNSPINIIDSKYNDYYLNPIVNRSSTYNEKNIVSEFGGLLLDGVKIGFYTLNIFNSYAYEFLLKLGFKKIILSVELSYDRILKLINSFNKRNGINIIPYVIKDGYINLMNIYGDPFDNKFKQITDKKNTYFIVRHDEYTSLSIPIEGFRRLKDSNSYCPVHIK